MNAPANPAEAEALVEKVFESEGKKDLLRFITCGSVDDGKSTLIGRLLYDAQLVYEDHLAALANESRSRPVTEDGFDFSLLVDGLQAEREQGITIDVAYRFFSTDKRKFIVADTPGHEQYTRNMATGASNADLAVILLDARKGVLTQTRRHSFIAALLGIRHVVAVVNKMDLVGWSQAVFDEIAADYTGFAQQIGLPDVHVVPISALKGENVSRAGSGVMPWYSGPTLLGLLETIDIARGDHSDMPLRFPVQWVCRPDLDFRGFAGTIAAGRVRPGDAVCVAASRRRSTVQRIVTMGADLPEAKAGDAVTVVLADEIDISRGDVLCPPDALPATVDQFQAHLFWMSDQAMLPGRNYLMRLGADTVPAAITELKHRIDVNTMEHLAARTLGLNELAVVNIAADRGVSFDPYRDNRRLGAFILIDRQTNATVGAGMIDFALRRARNVHWQKFDIDRDLRAQQKGQKPAILWFTGLSGSGKSTVSNIVEKRLFADGRHVYTLDGDNVRHGLNKDLGFTEADRVENIRRVAEVARLMAEAGLLVMVSFISPFERERRMAREIAGAVDFLEIHVDTPLEVCERRDPKGLYRKARAGEIKNFTGIDSPFEAPADPDLRLDGANLSPEAMAEQVLARLRTLLDD